MSTESITIVNYALHSVLIGAAGWLLVRFVLRDAAHRAILANLVVLMCLYVPFNISMNDLFPATASDPVWTPLRETFEHDWRVSVVSTPMQTVAPVEAQPRWDVNRAVEIVRVIAWAGAVLYWLWLLAQVVRVQWWAWRLRPLTQEEWNKLPQELNPERVFVFDHAGPPCVAGWLFPKIAVPASTFDSFCMREWRWLLRHEGEHLRFHDTVALLLQNIVRGFLWWNPLVHALIEEYARAREEACDAAAVGESRDHDDYAEFLLAASARSRGGHACVVPIARSRPAGRLKARLVALLEARGVRRKIGAWFMLACVAFAVIAPRVIASFGIVMASSSAAAEVSKPDDGALMTRAYKVPPDFLTREPPGAPKTSNTAGRTARQLLEKHGVTFPEGASAMYQASTSQLIVRNTRANLDLTDNVVYQLSGVLPLVLVECRLIAADAHLGKHGQVFAAAEVDTLIHDLATRSEMKMLTSPRITTHAGHKAIVEVVREVMPKTGPDGKPAGELKSLGPRIELTPGQERDKKLPLEVKIEMGVDPALQDLWSGEDAGKADWDRIITHRASAKATLGHGEALLLHLNTLKRPVDLLVSVKAIDPTGKETGSFQTVHPPRKDVAGVDLKDSPADPWAVRVYRVPESFTGKPTPVKVLQAAGIEFPRGADAQWKDGQLTVRNSVANLDRIEEWLDKQRPPATALVADLRVHVAKIRGDVLKRLEEWFPPDPETKNKTEEFRQQNGGAVPATLLASMWTVSGVITEKQMQFIRMQLAKTGEKMQQVTLKADSEARWLIGSLPKDFDGQTVRVMAERGGDGHTLELMIETDRQAPPPANRATTSVTIWPGQTVIMGAMTANNTSRLMFITGNKHEAGSSK